jgi:predicted nucleic acid-binding protein
LTEVKDEGGDRMRKLRIYIDTSVVGYLDQHDDPDLMADTHKLWEQIKDGIYDVVLSDITIAEIDACHEEKREILYEYLSEIVFTLIEVDEKTIEVAGRFIDLGVLREKSFDDCQHIAAAITSECDAIVSWNFKHIVNHKTTKPQPLLNRVFPVRVCHNHL